jgi:hypothetical protein
VEIENEIKAKKILKANISEIILKRKEKKEKKKEKEEGKRKRKIK